MGMAARADILLDRGENDPKNWDQPFGSGRIHIAITIFSDSEEKWRHTMELARRQYHGFSGVTVLDTQDFGAQPGDLNPLGYKDSIGQPAIEGSGVDPLPGQGRPIKAGEFILGYPGEAGVPLAMPQPDVLGRNGTFLGLRKYQSRVGAFNRFLRDNAQTDEERELLAAKLVGRWRSGAPLTLASGQRRPGARRGPAAEQRLHLRQRSEGQAGAAGLPHAPDEPAGYQDAGAHGREHPSHHPAQHDVRSALRSQRTFGHDDEVPHGLYFLFISARAMATLEFLQREWINDGNFTGVGDERDPIVGLQEQGATFTIPKAPVRRRIHGIQTFNALRGGEYMFMPSLSALKWLADNERLILYGQKSL